MQTMQELLRILARSRELDEAAWLLLGQDAFELCNDSARLQTACAACMLSFEHGQALHLLVGETFNTTGAAVMRLQFEAFVRAMWLTYAASEREVEKACAALNVESEKSAAGLPGLSEMISKLPGKAPAGAPEMINAFKRLMLPALNSFVHGGVHPLSRIRHGFSGLVLEDIVRNSNGIQVMTVALLSNLSSDPIPLTRLSLLQLDFADCLPELLTPAGNRAR